MRSHGRARKKRMTAPRTKKAGRGKRSVKKRGSAISPGLSAGLPAAESVREAVEFVSPQKVRYMILKTTERDAYDRPSVAPRKSRKSKKLA